MSWGKKDSLSKEDQYLYYYLLSKMKDKETKTEILLFNLRCARLMI